MGFANNPINQAQVSTSSYGPGITAALANALGAQGGQNQLVGTLQNEVNGGGPNLAGSELAAAQQQNIANDRSAAASAVGINPGAARYQASNNEAMQNEASAQAAAQLRQQLQLQAQGQEAGVLGNEASGQLFGTTAGAQNSQNNSEITNQQDTQQLQEQQSQYNAGVINNIIAGLFSAAGSAGSMGLTGLLKSPGAPAPPPASPIQGAAAAGINGAASANGGFAHGGEIPAMKHGGRIHGHARFPGDDSRNDTRLIRVSPGEDVIPRSMAKSPHLAALFVAMLNRRNGLQARG